MPNPKSDKIYRLQVGSYTSRANADRTERQVKNAGFDAAQETYGSLHRVLAEGIRADDLIAAKNALGAAGLKEIWVREYTWSVKSNKDSSKSATVLAAGIRVVPGLPNPKSDKIYRLQVGSYAASRVSPDRIERQVKNAGFEATQEIHGSLHRVIAEGIRAADVITAINVLRAAGFKEVWVREYTWSAKP